MFHQDERKIKWVVRFTILHGLYNKPSGVGTGRLRLPAWSKPYWWGMCGLALTPGQTAGPLSRAVVLNKQLLSFSIHFCISGVCKVKFAHHPLSVMTVEDWWNCWSLQPPAFHGKNWLKSSGLTQFSFCVCYIFNLKKISEIVILMWIFKINRKLTDYQKVNYYM